MLTDQQPKSELPIELAQTLLLGVIEQLVRFQAIDPKGKTREQLIKEVIAWIDPNDMGFVLDHTGVLRNEARLYKKKGWIELAYLLYAT